MTTSEHYTKFENMMHSALFVRPTGANHKKTRDANVSKDGIKNLIIDLIAASPDNTMKNQAKKPAWDSAQVEQKGFR